MSALPRLPSCKMPLYHCVPNSVTTGYEGGGLGGDGGDCGGDGSDGGAGGSDGGEDGEGALLIEHV